MKIFIFIGFGDLIKSNKALASCNYFDANAENHQIVRLDLLSKETENLENWLAADPMRKLVILWAKPCIAIGEKLHRCVTLKDALQQWQEESKLSIKLFRQYRKQVTLYGVSGGEHATEEEQNEILNSDVTEVFDSIADCDPHYLLAAKYAFESEPYLLEIYELLNVCSKGIAKKNIKHDDLAYKVVDLNKKIELEMSSLKSENSSLIQKVHVLQEKAIELSKIRNENKNLIEQLHKLQEEFFEFKENRKIQQAKSPVIEERNAVLQTVALNKEIEDWLRKNAKLTIAKRYKESRSYRKKLKYQVAQIESSGYFDKSWYLNTYKDVSEAKVDPVLHYLKYGALEGRNPSKCFDTNYYLSKNKDVASSGQNPLLHYVNDGVRENRSVMPGVNHGNK